MILGLAGKMIEANTSIDSVVKTVVPKNWSRSLRERLIRFRINHIFGPRCVTLADNEAAVTCVVKNGEFYINSFIEHYLQMGFRHIFFLDNGSIDNTITLAKRHRNVTIYQCTLPIGAYQDLFKKCLAEMVVPTGWCFDADIDEYFDYPFSNVISLSKFLEYLNRGKYSAVLVQMLDMFSDRPLATLVHKTPQENLKEVYRYYDLSQVSKVAYRASELARRYAPDNRLANENADLCFGGIRKTLFGLNCLLSKHSLFRTDHGLELFPQVHFMNKANVADISCIVFHYKLVSNAYETALQNKEAFPATRKGYEDLIRLIEINPKRQIKGEMAVEFRAVADLAESNFLFLSPDYRRYTGIGCT